VLERDGRREVLPCDTVVFTGDWIPDHELARTRGAELTRQTRAPSVDATGETTVPGVFAAGNLCHPVETADVAALGGRHVGEAVARRLHRSNDEAREAGVRIEVDEALAWAFPDRLRSTADLPPRGHLSLRALISAPLPQITVTQGDRTLWQRRVRLVAGRTTPLDCSWLPRLDPDGPPVHIGVG
jgi:hypothetical protein